MEKYERVAQGERKSSSCIFCLLNCDEPNFRSPRERKYSYTSPPPRNKCFCWIFPPTFWWLGELSVIEIFLFIILQCLTSSSRSPFWLHTKTRGSKVFFFSIFCGVLLHGLRRHRHFLLFKTSILLRVRIFLSLHVWITKQNSLVITPFHSPPPFASKKPACLGGKKKIVSYVLCRVFCVVCQCRGHSRGFGSRRWITVTMQIHKRYWTIFPAISLLFDNVNFLASAWEMFVLQVLSCPMHAQPFRFTCLSNRIFQRGM